MASEYSSSAATTNQKQKKEKQKDKTFPDYFRPDVTYWQQNPDAVLNIIGFKNLAYIPKEHDYSVTRYCGESSQYYQTHWHNSGYPMTAMLPSVCTLHLAPPEGTCAYRILFEDLDFTPNFQMEDYVCPFGAPAFKMAHSQGVSSSFCTPLTHYEAIIEVDEAYSGHYVLMLTDVTTPFKFEIKATAVPCTAINHHKSPNVCGIKNPGTFSRAARRSSASASRPRGRAAASGGASNETLHITKKSLLKMLRKEHDIYSKSLVQGLQEKKIRVDKEEVAPYGVKAAASEWPWMAMVEMTTEAYTPPTTTESASSTGHETTTSSGHGTSSASTPSHSYGFRLGRRVLHRLVSRPKNRRIDRPQSRTSLWRQGQMQSRRTPSRSETAGTHGSTSVHESSTTAHSLTTDHSSSTDHSATTDHSAITDNSGTTDHIATTGHGVTTDHSSSTDHSVTTDHSSSTDHSVTTDHSSSTDHSVTTDHSSASGTTDHATTATAHSSHPICNGVLVDESHVITPASCILHYTPEYHSHFKVTFGGSSSSSSSSHARQTATPMSVLVAKVYLPVTYTPTNFKDDMAVLELAEPIEFSSEMRPLCLPTDHNVFREETGIVMGRKGSKFVNDDGSIIYAPVEVYEGGTCSSMIYQLAQLINTVYPTKDAYQINLDRYICAGTEAFDPFCALDDGSVLARKDQTGAYILSGISLPINSCQIYPHNIYTKIEPNSPFLNMAMSSEGEMEIIHELEKELAEAEEAAAKAAAAAAGGEHGKK
ncbi:uncharacterized protein LOC135226446 [Macrobrachium nipponense]|uniref:uncharacterized protein LOC135226446 n=1 Tax=Macrobrachium nipponense TaxID=159736 RepID=UPI0030C8B52E